MVNVAREMERRGMDLPLLIGGATTSKQHTAVRIAPEYGPPTVHVLDASRVVGVVSALLDPARRSAFQEENVVLQNRLRQQHAERGRKPLLTLEEARANRHAVPFAALDTPPFTGPRQVEPDLAALRRYIDWQFFFHAWEIKGRFPKLLEEPVAQELYDEAQVLLDELVSNTVLQARGVYGFWPARAESDDVVLDEGTRFCFLRQQAPQDDGRPNRSLADYVSAEGDHIGAFAVSIHGADEAAARFEAEHDDYRSIMTARPRRPPRRGLRRVPARAGPARVVLGRRNTSRTRSSSASATAASGRPSATPPAPTTPEKRKLFDLLGAPAAGISLTETCAMLPASSVSGLYLAHPDSATSRSAGSAATRSRTTPGGKVLR